MVMCGSRGRLTQWLAVSVVVGSGGFWLRAQDGVTLAAGTPLRAQLVTSVRVREHQAVTARLIDPVFVKEQEVLPEGALLTGEIEAMTPDSKRRWQARRNGDFTPFHETAVRFTSVTLPSGERLPLQTTAGVGATLLRFSAAPPGQRRGSYVRQGWEMVKAQVKSNREMLTAPGKGERLEKFIYAQLPYHPEKLYRGVAYAFDLEQPLPLPARGGPLPTAAASGAAPPSPAPDKLVPVKAESKAPAVAPATPVTPAAPVVVAPLRAYLRTRLDSRSAKVGMPIEAMVAEPYVDEAQGMRIPQGATLVGSVTQAKAARWFGRGGTLRFAFREVRTVAGGPAVVHGVASGAEVESAQQLAMDSEGGVKPAPHDRILAPLVLLALAGAAHDEDGRGNSLGRDAVASNGFGLIGRVAGIASGGPEVAMGFGYYAAANSIYDRVIARGKEVIFPYNTRLEIKLDGSRENRLPVAAK